MATPIKTQAKRTPVKTKGFSKVMSKIKNPKSGAALAKNH
jgi:hypothetical protein